MLKTNRLAGIVEGIDFDEVINEKELARLRHWADDNRNLALNLQERNLISLIDIVLEDEVLTQDEKQQLLTACNAFADVDGTNALLYELGGVVDGILCDDEVNEKEVRALDKWLKAHGELAGNETYEFVKGKVDDVLLDDIVTKEEKLKLFRVLSKRMKRARLDYAISAMKAKIGRQELIGLDLIKLIENEDAIQRIYCRAEAELDRALRSCTGIVHDREIVFIATVLIGLLKYDSTFYDGVAEAFPDLYLTYSKAKIENLIRSTLSHFQDKWDDDYEGRIINIALSNALVPKYYLPAFFEFVFDIYRVNFDCSLSEEIAEDFNFAFSGLHTQMTNGNDDVSVAVTNKTYKLIRTTKDVIANEDSLAEVVSLSAMVAKIIDEHVWKGEVRTCNPYFKYGYEEWKKRFATDLATRKRNREQALSSSRWEPIFECRANAIYLVPPVHKIKGCYDYKDIAVNVYNGNKAISLEVEIDIREIIGGYKVIVAPIAINDPLGELTYQISAGDSVIYSSKQKLFRKILVFDMDGKEVRNNSDFEGGVVVCYKGQAALESFYSCAAYEMALYNACLGDVLLVDNDIFNFSAIAKSGVQGVTNEKCRLIVSSGACLDVYSEIAYCVFELEENAGPAALAVNGKMRPVTEFKHKEIRRPGFIKYVVSIDDFEPGIYSLIAYELTGSSKKQHMNYRFVYDPAFSAELGLIDEALSTVPLTVITSLLDEPINVEIDLQHFDERFLKFVYKGRRVYIPSFA